MQGCKTTAGSSGTRTAWCRCGSTQCPGEGLGCEEGRSEWHMGPSCPGRHPDGSAAICAGRPGFTRGGPGLRTWCPAQGGCRCFPGRSECTSTIALPFFPHLRLPLPRRHRHLTGLASGPSGPLSRRVGQPGGSGARLGYLHGLLRAHQAGRAGGRGPGVGVGVGVWVSANNA